MIILGFNSVSAAESSDVVEDSSADLSLSSSSDLEIIDDSQSSSEMISDESLSSLSIRRNTLQKPIRKVLQK